MNHYWTDNDHLATRQAQVEDWIEDLGEFPIGFVEEACREWRQTETRRPTPAAIRKLAIVAQRARREMLAITDRSEEEHNVRTRCRELYASCEERFEMMGCWCYGECKASA